MGGDDHAPGVEVAPPRSARFAFLPVALMFGFFAVTSRNWVLGLVSVVYLASGFFVGAPRIHLTDAGLCWHGVVRQRTIPLDTVEAVELPKGIAPWHPRVRVRGGRPLRISDRWRVDGEKHRVAAVLQRWAKEHGLEVRERKVLQ